MAANSTNSCAGCFNPAPLKCAKCRSISYCSQKCQKLHWKVHKLECLDAANIPLMLANVFSHDLASTMSLNSERSFLSQLLRSLWVTHGGAFRGDMSKCSEKDRENARRLERLIPDLETNHRITTAIVSALQGQYQQVSHGWRLEQDTVPSAEDCEKWTEILKFCRERCVFTVGSAKGKYDVSPMTEQEYITIPARVETDCIGNASLMFRLAKYFKMDVIPRLGYVSFPCTIPDGLMTCCSSMGHAVVFFNGMLHCLTSTEGIIALPIEEFIPKVYAGCVFDLECEFNLRYENYIKILGGLSAQLQLDKLGMMHLIPSVAKMIEQFENGKIVAQHAIERIMGSYLIARNSQFCLMTMDEQRKMKGQIWSTIIFT
jgi:MYND finger